MKKYSILALLLALTLMLAMLPGCGTPDSAAPSAETPEAASAPVEPAATPRACGRRSAFRAGCFILRGFRGGGSGQAGKHLLSHVCPR